MKRFAFQLGLAVVLIGCGDSNNGSEIDHEVHDSSTTNLEIDTSSASATSANSDISVVDKDLLVGLWQDSPMMASGWSTTYQFFPDGTFRLNESQMDCAKRLVWSKGTWKRVGEKGLELTVREWLRLEAGRMTLSDGSCSSDSMLVGAKEKLVQLEEPRGINLPIGSILIAGNDHQNRATVEIGGVKFYRFNDDPSAYP